MKVLAVQGQNLSSNFKGFDAGSLLVKASSINSWQQRAVLGAAAVTLQPFIDAHNKNVDEETRHLSALRSFSKTLVGAVTGVAIRGGCMKCIEQGFKNEKFTDAFAKATAADETAEAIQASKKFIKNGGAKKYAAVMGTIAALGVMLITNFAVDAPITNWLTNKLNKKHEIQGAAPEGGCQ